MLRHFAATTTRLVCGSTDAVQAVTGHKSTKMAEHYGALPETLQAESITKVEEFLNSKAQELGLGEQRLSKNPLSTIAPQNASCNELNL